MSGGADPQPDAEPTVHHLDDAGNSLEYAFFQFSNNIG
jgi:hypothetical protein